VSGGEWSVSGMHSRSRYRRLPNMKGEGQGKGGQIYSTIRAHAVALDGKGSKTKRKAASGGRRGTG
jgi:hypothetical protein